MQINKLELKNIKYFASMSEETPCYNADIFINGKKAIHVSNHGYGACDEIYAYPSFGLTQNGLKEFEQYLAKLNAVVLSLMYLDSNTNSWSKSSPK